MQAFLEAPPRRRMAQGTTVSWFRETDRSRRHSCSYIAARTTFLGGLKMDMTAWNLQVWLPAFFLLGLIVMGLMFAFIAACDKI
jgi:hypothetical protein